MKDKGTEHKAAAKDQKAPKGPVQEQTNDPGSSWQLYVVMSIILIGVIMLVLRSTGLL